MGNNHSEQEQQSKGNQETKQDNLSKQKKDTDIWSSFRNKTKAPILPQSYPFKPESPNLFKGIPDFISVSETLSLSRTQLAVEPPHVEERALDATPAECAFSPQTALTPDQLWGPREPSAYNISWDRPQAESPVPTPISAFAFPSVPENTTSENPQESVPQPITSASPTKCVAPCEKVSLCERKPPKTPKVTLPNPPPPVKPVPVTQDPGIKDGVSSSPRDRPVPFLFTATTPENTQVPSKPEETDVDHTNTSNEKSEKPTLSNPDSDMAQNTDTKNDKVKRQTTFVISEKTHAEIMSRLAYVEKQKLLPDPPVTQSQAVVRRALNVISYAEAVKKSQPKVNPARREAKAKLSKKVKISKSTAKQAQTGTVPEQPSNNSSTDLLSSQAAPDQGFTPKNDVKAATEQTTDPNQNEQSTISSNLIKLEKENLLATRKTGQDADNAPLKNTKTEHSDLTQNPSSLPQRHSVRKTNPLLTEGTPKTLFCQADSVHSASPIAVISKSLLEADFKAANVSSSILQDEPNQTCQSQLEGSLNVAESFSSSFHLKQIFRVERGKMEGILKGLSLQVDSKPGPKEDPAPTDNSQKCLAHSDVNAIHCEFSSPNGISKESQKPLIAPHRPALSSVFADSPHKMSTPPNTGPATNILTAQSDEQGIATAKATPAIILAQDPSNISDPIHHHNQTKLPTQTNQVQTNMKEVQNLPSTFKKTEKEDKNTKDGEKIQPSPRVPPSPEPLSRPEGRWHPFTTDRSCVRKVRCQHRENGKLPKNVTQWLNGSRNYLCEPSWATTASLAASIALSLRLDREDSCQ